MFIEVTSSILYYTVENSIIITSLYILIHIPIHNNLIINIIVVLERHYEVMVY